MQKSNTSFQDAKNKKRLIAQNIKLNAEVVKIQAYLSKLIEKEEAAQAQRIPSIELVQQENKIKQEIEAQEKQIKMLKSKLYLMKAENGKDNVQYIAKEEDELKIMQDELQHTIRQKETVSRFVNDKRKKLQINDPLLLHRKQLQNELKDVIHHNRDTAAKFNEIQREIRRHHLALQTKNMQGEQKNSNVESEIAKIQLQIQLMHGKMANLEQEFKPKLNQLDEEYQKKLKEFTKWQTELQQKERAYVGWEIRMRTIRDEEDLMNDKLRKSQLVVSKKLKQQLNDYLVKQKQKNKKRVNEQQLKYQFKSEQPAKHQAPLKKNEKVIEQINDDKNIIKMIANGKTQKQDKNLNTDEMKNENVSAPKSQRTAERSNMKGKNQPPKQKPGKKGIANVQEERWQRRWEAGSSENDQDASTSKLLLLRRSQQEKEKDKLTLPQKLVIKNIGMGTSFVGED